MRYRSVILIIVLIVGVPVAWAQVDEDDHRFRAEQSNAQASPAVVSGAGNTGTNRDYLSLILAALESYSASGGQAITFDYNLPDSFFKTHGVKTQLVLREPVLSTKLTEDDDVKGHADTLQVLQNELSYGDDVTLTLAVSPKGKDKPEKMRQAYLRTAPMLVEDRARELRTESVNRLNMRRNEASNRGEVMTREDEALAVAVEAARIQEEIHQYTDWLTERVAAATVNQSKFNFDASYRERRDSVGPDEWMVKASYEHGFNSAAETRADAAGRRLVSDSCRSEFRAASLTAGTACAREVGAALRAVATDPVVQQGRRFTVALEFHDVSAIDIARATPAVTFHSDSSRSLVWSIAGGRDVFEKVQPLEHRGRIELSLAYDDVSGDEARKDRMIGKLTYIQRINEKLHIPISLIYANHSDYLSNIDRKLNAHFGLAYKLPGK
jgi:hypothetical protein